MSKPPLIVPPAPADLFPEVLADPETAARRRSYSRHQHASGPRCSVEGCVRRPEPKGGGLCSAHRQQKKRFGRIVSAVIKEYASNSDDERYTLRPTLQWAMEKAGVDHIDLDVAACPESHWAEEWFGRQDDGSFVDALSVSWSPKKVRRGPRVGWMNQPYSMLEAFTERATLALVDGELDALLGLPPGDRCEQPWFQKWVEPYRDGRGGFRGVRIDTYPAPGRQKFGSPGDPGGLVAVQAPFPSLLIVWRRT